MTALDILRTASLRAVRRRKVGKRSMYGKGCVADRTCLDVSGSVRQGMLAEQLPHRGGVCSALRI